MILRRSLIGVFLVASVALKGWTSSGTEGASFLDIPVGGAPAALGSAYSAQANDVYAPVWNPAGLGFLSSTEFTGSHISYIDPVHYEHASFVMPLGKDHETGSGPAGIGASIQYLGTGNIDARDASGNPAGSFSTTFAAYSIAYGQKIMDRLSVGASAKLISEKIDDASANAYAADGGVLYKPNRRLSLGAVLANIGSDLKFVNEGDPLPTAGRFGATYQVVPEVDVSAEGVYRKSGLMSGGFGCEWRSNEYFTIRAGYNTAHIKELGAASGITAGMGIFFWGQEFSYAYVPMGDLGSTHYFSLVFRLNTNARPEKPRMKSASADDLDDMKENHNNSDSLYQLLNEDEKDHDRSFK